MTIWDLINKFESLTAKSKVRETLVSQNSLITGMLALSFHLPVIDVYWDIAVIWYFIINITIFIIRDINARNGVNVK